MEKWMNKSKLNRVNKALMPWYFLAPAIILLGVIVLFPICKVVQYSFYENMFYSDDPAFIGFTNYASVLADSRFISVIRFTVLFTGGSVIMHVCMGVLFAVLLNTKINKVALTVFRVIFVLPWVFTAAVVAVVWQLMLNTQGIVNMFISMAAGHTVLLEWLGTANLAVISLLVINAWRGYPTCMISFLAALQNIPGDIYEAADVDGASRLRQFFSLTLPQLKPVIFSVGLLDAIWTMNLFPLIWLTTGGGPLSATESIATFTYRLSFTEFEFGEASAMAIIGLLLTMIGVIFYMRGQKSVD